MTTADQPDRRRLLKELAVAPLVLMISGCVAAPLPKQASVSRPASPEIPRRFALVVGNGAYLAVQGLANPPNDAKAVAASLTRLGFKTDLLLDVSKESFDAAIDNLSQEATGADAAMVFYAGHGAEVGGENVLIPVSAMIKGTGDLRQQGIDFSTITAALDGKARTTLIVLDACRDNPFLGLVTAPERHSQAGLAGRPARSLVDVGLASVTSKSGSLIAFATAPGQVALDGDSGHSPFTAALLRYLEQPGVEVRQMLSEVRRDVREATNGQQIPWDTSSLEQSFYFRLPETKQVSDAVFAEARLLGIPLPPELQGEFYRRDGGPGSTLVGAWTSGKSPWFAPSRFDGSRRPGPSGKFSILIILSVDDASGRIDLIDGYSNVAATSHGAGYVRHLAILDDGAILFTGGDRQEYFFRPDGTNGLRGTSNAASIVLTRLE